MGQRMCYDKHNRSVLHKTLWLFKRIYFFQTDFLKNICHNFINKSEKFIDFYIMYMLQFGNRD